MDIEVILEVKTIYGTIPAGDVINETANSDSQTVTGQVDTIDVIEPGFNYNPDDTITFIDAKHCRIKL